MAELDLSGRTLHRYIAATEFSRSLPDHVRAQLGLDHLQKLAAVPDATVRNRLAHDAATMHWTRDQVGIAVAEYKASLRHGKKVGRKEKPAVLKSATALRAAVKHLMRLHGAANQLSPAHRAVLQSDLLAVRDALDGLLAGAVVSRK